MANTNPYIDPAELEPKPASANKPAEAWQGIPGTPEYKYITRMRNDLWQNLAGPDGWEVSKRPFSWTRDISEVFDTLRRAREQDYLAKETEARGAVNSPEAQAEIAREAEAATKIEFIDIPKIARVLNDFKERISLITNDLPPKIKQIQNVGGAERYFLIEDGSFEQNQREIFDPLANYGVKMDQIYYDVTYPKTHAGKGYFGWRIKIHDVDFVFLMQQGEQEAPAEASATKPEKEEEEPAATAEDEEGGGDAKANQRMAS